jgi:hypothetical protein
MHRGEGMNGPERGEDRSGPPSSTPTPKANKQPHAVGRAAYLSRFMRMPRIPCGVSMGDSDGAPREE